jgi:sialidase-1
MKNILTIALLLSTFQVCGQRSYIEYWTTKYTRNTEGDLIINPNGDIIAYYTRFYGGSSDDAGSEIYSKISVDSGHNWKPYQLTQANIGILNTMSVSAMHEGDTVRLFFLVRNSLSDLRPYMKVSNDNGATWGSPVALFAEAGYWVMNNNRVIRTSSGRLIAPVARVSDVNNWNAGIEAFTSSTWYSDNDGSTWSESNRLSVAGMSKGAMEPGVVELSPSNLLMYIRVQSGGKQYFSISNDNGATWGTPYQSNLSSPEVPAKIIKLSDGRLLAAHCNNSANQHRRPMTLSISNDGGITWIVKKVLTYDNTRYYAYPSLMEKEGYVYISYWEQFLTPKIVFSQRFERIDISDLN